MIEEYKLTGFQFEYIRRYRNKITSYISIQLEQTTDSPVFLLCKCNNQIKKVDITDQIGEFVNGILNCRSYFQATIET